MRSSSIRLTGTSICNPPSGSFPGSPAINAGTAIPGVTPVNNLTPDMGALEYGGTDWTPNVGYKIIPPPAPIYDLTATVYGNQVTDGSFENGNLANWTVTGNVSMLLVGNSWNGGFNPRTGANSVKFGNGASTILRTVTGLQPDRRYKLYAGTLSADGAATVIVGVTNFGYPGTLEVTAQPGNGVWAMNDLAFITGPKVTDTTADIYITVSTSSTTVPVYVDDVAVVRTETVPVAPPKSPLVQYLFDASSGNTATDSSIYGRDGSVTSAAPVWSAGKYGNALHFNGTGDYVTTPPIATPAALTVACWAKSDDATWMTTDFGCFASQTASFFFTPVSGGKSLRFSIYAEPTANPPGDSLGWTPTFDITAWHHYAAVFDPVTQQMQIYVDGTLAASKTTLVTALHTDTGPISIGRQAGSSSQLFKGAMDDIRIYGSALSAQEIADLV